MTSYGKIIQHYRKQARLSMAQLADGICTKNYIYLIESGQRIPSIAIMNQLSDRLNFDWRIYLEYLDHPSPIRAQQLMSRLQQATDRFDPVMTVDLLNALPDEDWVHEPPINYAVLNMKIGCDVFGCGDRLCDIDHVRHEFQSIIQQHITSPTYHLLQRSILQCLYYYAVDLVNQNAYRDAMEILCKLSVALMPKRLMASYQTLYIGVTLMIISLHCEIGEYDIALTEAQNLYQYQQMNHRMERIPFTLMKLGYALKRLGHGDKARLNYQKAVIFSRMLGSSELSKLARRTMIQDGYTK